MNYQDNFAKSYCDFNFFEIENFFLDVGMSSDCFIIAE